MTILDVAGITESGAHIYTSISVSEDYSETEVVKEIKRLDARIRSRKVKGGLRR